MILILTDTSSSKEALAPRDVKLASLLEKHIITQRSVVSAEFIG